MVVAIRGPTSFLSFRVLVACPGCDQRVSHSLFIWFHPRRFHLRKRSFTIAHGGGRSRKEFFLKTLKTQQHGSGPNLNASKEYRSRSPQSTVHTAFFVGISTRDVLNTETSAVDPHSYVIF